MTRPQILGMQLGNGYGAEPGAWRAPGVDPSDREIPAAHQRCGLGPRLMSEQQ